MNFKELHRLKKLGVYFMQTHTSAFNSLRLFLGLSLAVVTQCLYAEKVINSASNRTEEFAYKAQNPLSPTYSIPLKYSYHGGADNGGVSIGSIQPIIPVSLGSWNMINQLSMNFIGTPGVVHGITQLPEPYSGSGAYGLGDTTFTSLFTPVNSDSFSWGIGPTFVFPTDTLFSSITDRASRQLGSGKFSGGAGAMFVTQPKPWVLGLNVKQIWSVLGSQSRLDVSQMQMKPFVNYNLSDGWYLASNMDMIANWNNHDSPRWAVPIGGGVGKIFTIGNNAINIRAESYYNPIKSAQTSDWSANLNFQFLFGKHE